jgi:hypothetical protein
MVRLSDSKTTRKAPWLLSLQMTLRKNTIKNTNKSCYWVT